MSTSDFSSPKGEPSVQDEGTALDRDQLAHRLSEIARSLEAERDPEAMLGDLVRAAVALIPGADEASLSVVQGRVEVSSRHATSDLPQRVDDLQTRTRQGPCLDAAFEQQTVRVPDMASENRWPDFAAEAAKIGAASMLSFQLYVERDNLGALNLYSRTADAFTDESEHIGLLFASHAAIAFADAQKVQNLQVALASRDVIGQAKGILMERFKITEDHAFLILVRASQESNRKVTSLAQELSRTGHLNR